MTDVEQARAEWVRVRSQHESFGELLCGRLRALAKELGIYTEVSVRAKETHSLVKKLIRKPHLTYETLPDKVGARVIVRYRSDLLPIEQSIKQRFAFKVVEDKALKLGLDRVGYQSIHIDYLALKPEDNEASTFPSEQFFAEVQVRTYAQHLWSEATHDTFYKNDEMVNKLSPDLQRCVNLAAGLVEVADREFDRMNKEARPSPAIEVYNELEKLYYSVSTKRPDVELSLAVIDLMLPLYGEENPQEIMRQHVLPTFERHRHELELIYSNPENNTNSASAFFFQPEALLIFDRLHFDRDQLLSRWNEHFPERELDRVATNFGFSLE